MLSNFTYKIIEKMKYKILYVLLICFSLFACDNERWGDYYDASNTLISNQTVLEAAKANSEISNFIALLQELKLDKRLSTKEVLTLMAPKNGSFDLSTMTEDEKLLFAKNHLLMSQVILSEIAEMTRFRALSSKFVRITPKEKGHVINETISIDSKINVCKNGSCITIENPIKIEPNLYDAILNLSDEYSIIRDTLKSHHIRLFDKNNSKPIDVDNLGNIVYDSIFYDSNEYFAYTGSFTDESKQYTAIVPTNEQYLEAQNEVFDFMQNKLGKYPQHADTVMVQNWILKAMVYEQTFNAVSPPKKMESLRKELWISKKQGAFNFVKSVSNGNLISPQKVSVPKYKYIGNCVYHPAIWFSDLMTEEKKTEYFNFGEAILPERFTRVWDTGIFGGAVHVALNSADEFKNEIGDPEKCRIWFESLPVKEIESGGQRSLVVQNLVPGRYKVTFAVRSWKCTDMQVYVNGKKIGKPGGSWNDRTYDRKEGFLGYYTHEEGDPKQVFVRFQMAKFAPPRMDYRMTPFIVKLIPTESVY
ncbi:hypothetical protein EMN47_15845 [Prolixibacteraceae bacterium JC049]|nr:hypothetical protein [Prolixibacteraceae bacterium JC049]